MLNEECLIQGAFQVIYDNICDDGEKIHLYDISDLHDWLIDVTINGIRIEDYDALYWTMCNIIEMNGDEMIEEINAIIDDECQSYYGDPAFASASDYWGYILG